MQRLSRLVSTPADSFSLPDLSQEAKSVAENAVKPALNDLRLKIEQAEDTAWQRAFGRELTLVPLIGFAFAAPTPELLGSVLDRDPEDVDVPASAEQAMRPGFSLLLEMD